MLLTGVNFLMLFMVMGLTGVQIARAQSNDFDTPDRQLPAPEKQGKYALTDCFFSKHKESKIRGCTLLIEQGIRQNRTYRYRAYYKRGNAYREQGDYDLAIADYTNAIKLEPRNAVTYHHRGNAYLERGEFDRAIADFTSAIKIDPRYAAAYGGRGKAYRRQGNRDRANSDDHKAIELGERKAAKWSKYSATLRKIIQIKYNVLFVF
jgi:tetratricopeptide (TPR) repeat protein